MSIKVSVTVDVVAFAIEQNSLDVLLIKRKYEPFRNQWALPGGYITDEDKSMEDAARRELVEETNVENIYLEQLYTFGDVGRDPRGRTVTVSYIALLRAEEVELVAATDASGVAWWPIEKLPSLGFDHKEIIEYALTRLRYKIEYTDCVFSLLPEAFTLRDLQNAYEVILGHSIDNRNFRKKFLSTGILVELDEYTRGGPHRPARLYRFSPERFESLSDRPVFTF